MTNIAKKDSVESKTKIVKSKRDQELDDLKLVLNNKSGRRFIWKLLSRCRVFGSVVNPDNPNMTFYRAGEQDTGHYILTEIMEADPNLFLKMQKEAQREKQIDKQRNDVNEQRRNDSGFEYEYIDDDF